MSTIKNSASLQFVFNVIILENKNLLFTLSCVKF